MRSCDIHARALLPDAHCREKGVDRSPARAQALTRRHWHAGYALWHAGSNHSTGRAEARTVYQVIGPPVGRQWFEYDVLHAGAVRPQPHPMGQGNPAPAPSNPIN